MEFNFKKKAVTFRLFILFFNACVSERILAIFPAAFKSHHNCGSAIVEALAERGHNITFISPFRLEEPVKNVEEIVLRGIVKTFENQEPIDWFAVQREGKFNQVRRMIQPMADLVKVAYHEMMGNAEFRRILEERKADLILFDPFFSEFIYAFYDQLKVPMVSYTPISGFPITMASMGAAMDYAIVPGLLTDFDDQMSFFQRIYNMLLSEILIRDYQRDVTSVFEDMVKKDFPEIRPFSEIEKEISLCLMNQDPSTQWPRALPPKVIPIGAVHARQAKPLPKEFNKFVEEAPNGFILFTLGGFVPVSSMSKENLQMFLNVFAKLNFRIIWKWEGEVPKDIPSNIIMTKWVPQQDLLGNPKARLFIYHGGLMGVQEAAYHAVPLLGLPFGNDGRANVAKAVREGYALKLNWDEISEEILSDTIHHLLYDSSFQGNATRVARLMRDVPIPSKAMAAYWIEHVLRHGGTKHLDVGPKNMPLYQRHLIDVILFLIFAPILVIIALLAAGYYVFTKHLRSPKLKTN